MVKNPVPGRRTIDVSALERLRRPLMQFFMRRVGEQSSAEDLTQETFARMLGVARKEDIDDPQAFVFQIALNLLRDRGRRAKARNDALLTNVDSRRVSDLTLEFVEDRTPERVLIGKDDIAEVVRALNELGERTRDIFVLFRLEKMKHAEIAALFGISRSTVEKEVMRAALHLSIRFGPRS